MPLGARGVHTPVKKSIEYKSFRSLYRLIVVILPCTTTQQVLSLPAKMTIWFPRTTALWLPLAVGAVPLVTTRANTSGSNFNEKTSLKYPVDTDPLSHPPKINMDCEDGSKTAECAWRARGSAPLGLRVTQVLLEV